MKIKPKVKKYGKGGSIKDDIININGDYYNNDIIDGLDRDARVLNNQENKFLNRYGVTDRNSFYNKFPTEEIFNFKNGSDKARHYGLSTPYVDETTITLKNGGSINKYPNGGRQPIIVNDKNDPRLQASDDSLHTFNNVQRFNNLVKEYYDKNIGNKAIDHHDNLASSINPFNKTPIVPIDEARLMRDKFNQYKNQIISSVENSPYEADVEYERKYIHTPSRFFGHSFADRANPNKYANDFSFEVPLYSFPKPVQPIVYQPTISTRAGDVTGDKIAKSKDNVAVLNSKLVLKNRPKEPTFELKQEQQLLPETNSQLDFDPIGLKKGTYFTRPRQQQEAGQGNVDYFDNKTGKLLKTMEFGGKSPKYEWSKGIDNIQPITQTQNNSSITTGNKKLSTEELKKAAEYTKKYNQQHLEEEYNNRQNKLKQSIDAQKQPLSLKNLQTQTQSTGDKLSLAMNSKYGNPKDYPTLSGYMQGLDYINPAKMIGDMTSGLGSVPQDIKQGNYLKAGLSLASPLAVGAIAGVGANGVKPFVNNLANPFAGTKEIVNNLDNKYLPKFKSEINWSKWNKEIPENKALTQEYNTIEQTSKANGSWMKNPDGSAFQGTPEQFVQQNSSNFKKAFPEGSENVFRGTGENIAELRPNRSTFTANQELASGYAPFNKKSNFLNSESVEGGVHSFYRKNSKNSLELDANNTSWTSVDLSNRRLTKDYFERNIKSQEGQITKQKEYLSKMKQNPNGSWEAPDGTTYSNDLYKNTIAERELYLKDLKERYKNIDNLISNPKELEEMGKVLGNTTTTDDIAAYVEKRNLDYVKLKNIEDSGVGDVTIVNHKPGNYLKSAIGNNGMFDMTNPNIYKALVPGVIGLGAASQIDKKEFGGNITTENDKPIKYGYGGSISYKDFKKKYKDL